jgi:chemotaxis protein CheX
MLRKAAVEVFTTMLGVTPEAAEPYTSTAASLSSNGVVSLVGLAGAWAGTGGISCTAECACMLAGQLMMCEYDAVTADVLDAMAELTNMIIGNVKTCLEETVGPLGLSIPTVIYGRNFCSRTVGQQEWTVLPFFVNNERVEVQICLTPSRDTYRTKLPLTAQHTVEV